MEQRNSPIISMWRKILRRMDAPGHPHMPKNQRSRVIVGRKFNGKLGWQPIFKTLPRI